MLSVENYLSEETTFMVRSVGGWTAEANAVVSHVARYSRYTETLISDVQGNSMKATATAGGDMTVITEQFAVDPGVIYRGFAWVAGAAALDTEFGIRFYSVSGDLLLEDSYIYAPLNPAGWNGMRFGLISPENTKYGELFVTYESAAAADEMFISHPGVMQENKITTDFVDYALYHIPDYMIEADLSQTAQSAVTTSWPMTRYVTLGSKQLSDTQDGVTSWDHIEGVSTDDGDPDTSSLVDPFKAEPIWLPWVAQLMGVSLDTIPSGGRSPWLSFEGAGIDEWREWEEDIDPGSIVGIPDTEWVDIESFSPDFFDTVTARRLQIASGFNGVLGGTSESIVRYVAALLNTDEDDPFVYVIKHYGTNPYRILVATLGTEDPDPNGDMLELAIEAATPAGTDVITRHGVSVTARTFYSIPDMWYNMWTDLQAGGSILPTRFVENGAANGRHLVTASISGSTQPFLGGGLALARWYPGFAAYSGAVELETDASSAYNVVGDIDIRVLVSNVEIPASGVLEFAASPGKWALSVTSTGTLQFDWENGGSNTVTSTVAAEWGNVDKGPFWVRVVLDVNNDAAGHDVLFYASPTLYEEPWPQLGTTVTTAGTSGLDSTSGVVTLLGNDTNPEDSASAILYRFMLHNGIEGTIVTDINLTGEIDFASSTINTGAPAFILPITSIRVGVNAAAIGATNLVESTWTAQAHRGGDDYFYFGLSPYKYDSGNTPSLGDTIAATGLPSDTYDWTIALLGGGSITGSTGTVTGITWDADDHGGSAIVNIVVRESTGSTVQGLFEPTIFAGKAVTGADGYGTTWDLTRVMTTSEYYEHSAIVDRDYISPSLGAGAFYSDMTFDADETITVAAAIRRFWSGSGIVDVVDHTTTSGWKIRYNGPDIEAIITDGATAVTLTYDEAADNNIGEWILVTLRRDVGAKAISLWVGETMVDSAADPFTGEGLFTTTGSTGIVGEDAASNKFDLRYLGLFDRNLTDQDIAFLDGEMAQLFYMLPQAAKGIGPTFIPSATVVYTPGFDLVNWNITPAVIDASPTIHTPTLGGTIHAAYISTAYTIYEPTMAITVQAAYIAAAHTIHDPTVTGGA